MINLINRTLYIRTNRQTQTFSQSDLADLAAPLIVLGEAGMGKTRLLEWLADQPSHAMCTARQLINRPDPRSLLGNRTTLVIDALDEVVARREGDAVDLVLQKLGILGYPRFVLSCRVADWQSATSVATIGEHYEARPQEMHLEPLSEADAIDFLTVRLSAERATEVIERVAPSGVLPQTSSELFERTVDIVWKEHRDEKALTELTRVDALDAAGAAFAALLLTGNEAISRLAAANLDESELALPEVEAFDSGRVDKVFSTRLFRSLGSDRFSYWHRRIGEYLAARWLAAHADTRGKRGRLMSMFQSNGLVPASLRGLHAWLALDPSLAPLALAADPMGVIEYGDADVLDVGQARQLMRALRRVADEDPRFRDQGPYRAQGLVQPALLPDVQSTINDPGTPFGIKLLLLEQLERSPIAVNLANQLTELMLDPQRSFAERSSAADALAALTERPDWPALLEDLRRLADQKSTRLAVELLGQIGIEHFEDREIAEIVLAHTGLTLCSVERRGRERLLGPLFTIRQALPVERVGSMLDIISDYFAALADRANGDLDDLIGLVVELVARCVTADSAAPERLWSWLNAVLKEDGYNRRAQDALAEAFKVNNNARRGLQRKVLLGAHDDKNMWQRAHWLRRRSVALIPSAADLIALLGELDPADRDDLRWRDLLEMSRHDATEGIELRVAAKPFAAHRAELLEYIEKLAEPRIPDWMLEQYQEQQQREAQQATERAAHREHYRKHLKEMRNGEFEHLFNPSQCYMKMFIDIGDDLEAHQRIAQWLDAAAADAAHQGFEVFINATPPRPNAVEIAHSLAENLRWSAGSIIVAAMAERRRLGQGFADLRAERVIAAWLELRHREDEHAGLSGLSDALEEELRRRRKWRSALILLIEPQLEASRTHIEYLYELMRNINDKHVAVDLAMGWLRRIKSMANDPEHELVARVLASNRSGDLCDVAKSRLSKTDLSHERRTSWLAVFILIDLDGALKELNGAPIDKNVLWELRDHLGARRRDDGKQRLNLSMRQLHWIVQTFRRLWPVVAHPSGVTTGDTNPWDATDFLNGLIARIGDDIEADALSIITDLGKTADGYSSYLQIVAAEQRRKLVETRYRPPNLAALTTALTGGPPASAADLQAVMLEELEIAQARLKGDPIDWYTGFFKPGGAHKGEEDCRDELLKMLDGKVIGVQLRPESHLADEKRVDIECTTSATVMLPIEVKGQWHSALWTAADNQLEKLYSSDWRADRRGIYLVLWFGPGTPVANPPADVPVPTAPEDLRSALEGVSSAAKNGLVKIVVLDLMRS